MPEVDPATLARFVESRAPLADQGRFAPVSPPPGSHDDGEDPAVIFRLSSMLRASQTSVGAAFRGLEQEIGAPEAVKVIHEFALAEQRGQFHGFA